MAKEKTKKKKVPSKSSPPTQRYLEIAEIRDDMVIMRDGSVRAVLLVSSINFALKSGEEQEAIIQNYIQFLNGLNFQVQICIQSRRMNIDAYDASLVAQMKKTTNDLLRAQIEDYRSFVTELLEIGEIMQKRFYVVVPYDPLTDEKRGFFSRASDVISPAIAAKLSKKQYNERVVQLNRRTEIMISQLLSIGLTAVRLDTQSLVELYYTSYNPDVFDSEPMTDIGRLNVETTIT